ncbi:hypothetical protein ACHAQA_006607 [Verticillium albo-atrum]
MDIMMNDAFPDASLVSLPAELVDQILIHLPTEDVASLRLTSRHLLPIATSTLFRTIHISPLYRDRHTFLRIAACPHLALAVRNVVWYELADGPASVAVLRLLATGDSSYPIGHWAFTEFADVDRPSDTPDLNASMLPRVVREANAHFWWRVPASRLEGSLATLGTHEEFEAAEHEFYPLFLEALEHMQGLVSVVSMPMPPLRDVRPKGSDSYPFSSQIFQSGSEGRTEDRNLGLKSFLLPAMGMLAQRKSGPIVQRLHLADEGINTCLATIDTGLKLVCEGLGPLTHLDLCVSSRQSVSHGDYEDCVLRFLRLTVNLTHLTLCFEREARKDWRSTTGSLLSRLPHFPKLVSVTFNSISGSTDHFVAFVGKHAKTLQEVYLESFFLDPEALRSMAAMKELRLRRFVVLPHKEYEEWDESFDSDVEGSILDFVNSGGSGAVQDDALFRVFTETIRTKPPGFPPAVVFEVVVDEPVANDEDSDWIEWDTREHEAVQTHPAVYDANGWTTAAICDSRNQGRALYHSGDIFDLDEEAGDLRENRDTENERTYGSRNVETADLIAERVESDDESIFSTAQDQSMPIRKDTQMMDEENDHSQHTRVQLFYRDRHAPSSNDELVPRWFFARNSDPEADPSSAFCYRPAQPEDIRTHMTETWHFQHRNGEEAWGDEPLEFWEFWEGSEAGDIAEATPYGAALDKFMLEADVGEGWEELFARAEWWGWYDAELDPLVSHPDDVGPDRLSLPGALPVPEDEDWDL